MRRATVEQNRADVAAFDRAVEMWRDHPDIADGPAVDAWTRRYESFVERHGLDPVAVVAESIRRGVPDPPWTL